MSVFSDTPYVAVPLAANGFAAFGEVLELSSGPFRTINQGRSKRLHDPAQLNFDDGQAEISLFQAEVRTPLFEFDLLERHPQGSQCYVPTEGSDYPVAVALEDGGEPGAIHAFDARGSQTANDHRNTWHAELTPISGTRFLTVIDRIGDGLNLDEHRFDAPIRIDKFDGRSTGTGATHG